MRHLTSCFERSMTLMNFWQRIDRVALMYADVHPDYEVRGAFRVGGHSLFESRLCAAPRSGKVKIGRMLLAISERLSRLGTQARAFGWR